MTINAALRRIVPASMRDLSATGCLLEVQRPASLGEVGVIEVEIDGTRYAEWFRVVRIEKPRSPADPHLVGVEFLQLALAGEESLRVAIANRRGGGSTSASGKLSGNSRTSGGDGLAPAAASPADTLNFTGEAGDPAAVASGTKVAARLLNGRWRARIARVRHKQQEKRK